MAWQKKSGGARLPMTWQIDSLEDDNVAVATHLQQLVADGWFVHSIAPRYSGHGMPSIYIVSCKRGKAVKAKKAKTEALDA